MFPGGIYCFYLDPRDLESTNHTEHKLKPSKNVVLYNDPTKCKQIIIAKIFLNLYVKENINSIFKELRWSAGLTAGLSSFIPVIVVSILCNDYRFSHVKGVSQCCAECREIPATRRFPSTEEVDRMG